MSGLVSSDAPHRTAHSHQSLSALSAADLGVSDKLVCAEVHDRSETHIPRLACYRAVPGLQKVPLGGGSPTLLAKGFGNDVITAVPRASTARTARTPP